MLIWDTNCTKGIIIISSFKLITNSFTQNTPIVASFARTIPQLSGVVLFLKDTGLSSNDNSILVHLLPHVDGVTGPVQGEEEGTIAHSMNGHLKMAAVH